MMERRSRKKVEIPPAPDSPPSPNYPKKLLATFGVKKILAVILILVVVSYAGHYLSGYVPARKAPAVRSASNATGPPPLNVTELRGRPLFVFGDSTVDAGNFNHTGLPYGIDLPYKDTGRFSNGFTVADRLALKLQTEIPRAFNRLGVDELRKKVNINFASGGCGLMARTSPIPCTSVGDQVMQFITSAAKHVEAESSIFFISAGANDYIFSFTGENSTKFAEEVVGKLETYMKVLYSCGGARIFLINKLAPIGCIPDKKDITTSLCNEMLNKAAQDFNKNLERTLINFKLQQHDAQIFLADTQQLYAEISNAPLKFGLKNVTHPCCGDWNEYLKKYDCGKETKLCPTRDDFLFFDGAHFTEKANELFVDYCLDGTVCYPL